MQPAPRAAPAPPPPPPAQWTGPYIGGELFGSWGRATTEEFEDPTGGRTNLFEDDSSSLGGGIEFGYDWAVWGGTDLGPEVDLGPMIDIDFNGDDWAEHDFGGGEDLRSRIDWQVDIDARLGFDVNERLRFYGVGGLSVGSEETQIHFGGPQTSERDTVTGGNLGAGAEWRPSTTPLIGKSTSLFLEYRHTWWNAVHLDRPAASPGFDYSFRSETDRFGVGVRVGF